ncbi:MAG: long-chain-acyl-CoA synthetase [Halieaceae bacterium]|nr:long-chain-acyl-CoA synthetase [Halieaceae bacterium]
MSRILEFFRVLREFSHMIPALRYKPPADDDAVSMAVILEDTVARHPDSTMLMFEGREWTWDEFNRDSNRLAHYLQSQGIKRGNAVALYMENRGEYLLAMFALMKLGAIAGLINNSLTGRQLAHCINTVECTKCIFGEELVSPIEAVRAELGLQDGRDYLWMADANQTTAPDWAVNASIGMLDQATHNLPQTRDILAGETALYVFTSGTTGLPKAALQPHRKLVATSGVMARVGFRFSPQDRLYCCLPLYHITGLVPGVFGAITLGASIFLRRKFSASQFWEEVRQYNTNSLIYIGELCRYLANQPALDNDGHNPMVKMLGNGLRPDVWDDFRHRFKVERICEIYGASEGNIGFLNMLNKEKTIGATTAALAVVEYDVDNDEMVRNAQGRCTPVAKGEPGLLLGKVDEVFQFDGYKDKSASEAKLFRDVLEPGDCYFNTGDLIREIDVGFAMGFAHYQFVDRTGDTFRWRSENVSTNEVGEILNSFEQVEYTNIYGVEVPGAEGRAGMAAVVLKSGESFDAEAFSRFVERQLPGYARPVFLRIQQDLATTQTFKLVKGDLRKAAYHLGKIADPLYVLKPRSDQYEPLDRAFYSQLIAGDGGY